MNKTKLKGTQWGRVLSMAAGVICLGVMSVPGLDAATLWNNGTTQNFTASEPNDYVSGTSGFTVFDSFNVAPIGWVVTGFDITDFFVGTPTGNYKNTSWSIWNGNPLTGGTLVASANNVVGTVGTPTGTCGIAGTACSAMITVNFATSVNLSSGTYFLGSQNTLTNGSDVTARAFSSGNNNTADGWAQAQGSTTGVIGSKWSNQGCGFPTTCSSGGDTAFDIIGGLAPEPGTFVLMGLALIGVAYRIRRKIA